MHPSAKLTCWAMSVQEMDRLDLGQMLTLTKNPGENTDVVILGYGCSSEQCADYKALINYICQGLAASL